MPSRRSELMLRRLVAELAEATADDVEAILDQLEPGHRTRAEALLASCLGTGADDERGHGRSIAAVARDSGASGWLVERLGAVRRAGAPAAELGRLADYASGLRDAPQADFTMTPAAVEALRACANSVLGPGSGHRAPGLAIAGGWARWRARLGEWALVR